MRITYLKLKIMICLWLISSLSLHAQMTLNDCLVYAAEHAHTNILSRLETEAAAVEKDGAIAGMLPYIGLNSSGSVSFGRNIDPETNTYDNKRTLYTGFSLDMSLPLFDGLVSVNNLKAMQTALMRKRKAALVEQDRISIEVIKAFYNVSYCRALVSQMEQQLQRDSTDLAATERGEELGIKSGADVAEIKAIVAADHYELINQINLLKKAYLNLRSSMGMELTNEPLDLTEEPLSLPENVMRHKLPALEEAELAVNESQHYLNSARGAYSPKLSFNTGVSTSFYRMMGTGITVPTFSRQLRDNMGEYIGLSLSIPLFDGLSTANRVKRAKINLLESRTRLDETRYKLQRASEEAYLDVAAATEELTAATSRLEAEQIAYNAIRRKFELGSASAIDLYTASSKLVTARANLEGKRIQRIIAEITLRYYQGYPLINQ